MMILVSSAVAEELVKDSQVNQNFWIWPVFVDLEVNVLIGAFKIGVHPAVLGGPGQHSCCHQCGFNRMMEWLLWYHCGATGILHRAFVAYFTTRLLKTQSANMKNSNTCKAFPALRAIGSNRYSPNCRNPWYIQYKPDLYENKNLFSLQHCFKNMDISSSDNDKALEAQGRNMIWCTDCEIILIYSFSSPICGTPSSKLSGCLCTLNKD